MKAITNESNNSLIVQWEASESLLLLMPDLLNFHEYLSIAKSWTHLQVTAIMQHCQWLTMAHDNAKERADIIADSSKTQQVLGILVLT